MKVGNYQYDTDATHFPAIWESSKTQQEANNSYIHDVDSQSMIVGSSEWIWLEEETARRLCALLTLHEGEDTEKLVIKANARVKSLKQTLKGRKMTKVNKEQYNMMLNMALEFSKGHKSVSHDTLRPDIEYVWVGTLKVAEIRHKGRANEEYYMMDFK